MLSLEKAMPTTSSPFHLSKKNMMNYFSFSVISSFNAQIRDQVELWLDLCCSEESLVENVCLKLIYCGN